jgi:hypothetical protein
VMIGKKHSEVIFPAIPGRKTAAAATTA